MCQTEMLLLTPEENNEDEDCFPAPVTYLKYPKIVNKREKSSFEVFTAPRGEETSYTKNEPVLPLMPRCTDADFQTPEFHAKSFIPWLNSVRLFLLNCHFNVLGPDRNTVLRKVFFTAMEKCGSAVLKSALDSAIDVLDDAPLQEVVDHVLEIMQVDSKAIDEAACVALLGWRYGSMAIEQSLFHFLELYERVSAEECDKNENSLKNLLRSYIHSNTALQNAILGLPLTYAYIIDGKVAASHINKSFDSCDHRYLLCLICHAVERTRSIMGAYSPFVPKAPVKKIDHVQTPSDPQPEMTPKGKFGFSRGRRGNRGQNNPQKGVQPPNNDVNKKNKTKKTFGKVDKDSGVKGDSVMSRRVAKLIRTAPAANSNVNAYSVKSLRSASIVNTNLKSKNIVALFDTGNDAITIFPFRLMEYAHSDLTRFSNNVRGLGAQSTELIGSGTVTFEVPLIDGSNGALNVFGHFMSQSASEYDDEVTLHNSVMPKIPKFTETSDSSVMGCQVRDLAVPVLCNLSFRSTWTPVHKLVKKVVSRRQLRDKVGERENTVLEWSESMGFSSPDNPEVYSESDLLSRLHRLLGHPNREAFITTLNGYGLAIPDDRCLDFYEACRVCSLTGNSRQSKIDKHIRRGVLAQQDLTEFSRPGIGGYKYVSVIIETTTKYISVHNCRSKRDSLIHAANFLNSNPHVTALRVDGAGELNSDAMKEIVNKHGVGLEGAAPGASESLGGVERANLTIKDKVMKLMQELEIEIRGDLWPWFTSAAASAHNFTVPAGKKDSLPPFFANSELRHSALGSLPPVVSMPRFCFGDPVYFKTPREIPSSDETDVTVSQERIGLFIAHVHSGENLCLCLQRGKVVIFITHSKNVRACAQHHVGRLRSAIKA